MRRKPRPSDADAGRGVQGSGPHALRDKLADLAVVTMHLCRSTFIASGGFEPLRVLLPGKSVVLGLVTSKIGTLEHPDDIRRIEETAEAVWG